MKLSDLTSIRNVKLPSREHGMSRRDIEALVRMLTIQDHLAEYAIKAALAGKWAELPERERIAKANEMRTALEDRNAIFPLPKEAAIAELKSQLNFDDPRTVPSFDDKAEKHLIKQEQELRKSAEKDLHREARKIKNDLRKLDLIIDGGGVSDIHAALEVRRKQQRFLDATLEARAKAGQKQRPTRRSTEHLEPVRTAQFWLTVTALEKPCQSNKNNALTEQ
jgi:hypothetical protein